MKRGPFVLLTDFGGGPYVGQMKGVLATLAPGIATIDLAHDVAPQDVAEGAFHLRNALPHFPPGSIFIAVVDPGVGTARRAICVEAGSAVAVGPDNGLLSLLPRRRAAYVLENSRYRRPDPAPTFHGRDVFAPAAAHLARGLAPTRLGRRLDRIVELPRAEGGLKGTVVTIDRFGNLITDIEGARVPAGARVRVGARRVGPLVLTYGDAREGDLLALVGSSGHVEVAVRNGSAARVLRAGRGTAVTVGNAR
jgi:S-adenosylmethionine hydrolase